MLQLLFVFAAIFAIVYFSVSYFSDPEVGPATKLDEDSTEAQRLATVVTMKTANAPVLSSASDAPKGQIAAGE